MLRWAAWLYLAGWGLHVVDHLQRGMSSIPPAVMSGGSIQAVFVVVAVGMAIRGSGRAPTFAIFVGVAGALLFTYAHLIPTYFPNLQDSFIDGPRTGVTWFSWLTAFSEIGTGLVFAYAGLKARRAGR